MVNGLAGGSVSVYGALIINTSTETDALATSTKNTYINSAKSYYLSFPAYLLLIHIQNFKSPDIPSRRRGSIVGAATG
jgi:hypothetical protein